MSQPQHMVALAKADEVRLAGVAVKREIASGGISLSAALDDERAQPVKICDLLNAQRGWGDFRTRNLLGGLGIGELRRVRELTPQQCRKLTDHFDPPPAEAAPEPPPIPPGMEPECVDARVLAALTRGPVTRVELGMRVREMCLAVDDLDASLERLTGKNAVVVREAAGFELYDVGPRYPAVLLGAA